MYEAMEQQTFCGILDHNLKYRIEGFFNIQKLNSKINGIAVNHVTLCKYHLNRTEKAQKCFYLFSKVYLVSLSSYSVSWQVNVVINDTIFESRSQRLGEELHRSVLVEAVWKRETNSRCFPGVASREAR